jgi:Tol biopolymer transport system component
MNNKKTACSRHVVFPVENRLLLFMIILYFAFSSCAPGPYNPPSSKRFYPLVNSASFSPNGEQIVISVSKKCFGGIFLANRNGKVIKTLRLDTAKYWNGYPVFSPKGNEIAFVSTQADEHGDIYIMDTNGSNVRRLTASPYYDRWPCFSTNGENIFFSRAEFFGNYSPVARKGLHDNDIYTVNTGTGKEIRITNQKLYSLSYLNTFPEGNRLVIGTYRRVRGSKGLKSPDGDFDGYNIWTLFVDRPHRWKPIAPDIEKFKADPRIKPHAKEPIKYTSLYDPVLSHDGKYLVFSWWGHYNDLYGYQLYITDMDTMDTRMLTHLQTDTSALDFSPDNKAILFLADPRESSEITGCANNLWMINRDGTGLRRIRLDFSAVMKQKPPKPQAAQ